jgi:hypothetical protein
VPGRPGVKAELAGRPTRKVMEVIKVMEVMNVRAPEPLYAISSITYITCSGPHTATSTGVGL